MKKKLQIWFFGFVIGVIIAFPLGTNFGRDAPLLSNPFAAPEVKDRMTEKVKEGAGRAVESTKKGAEKVMEEAKEKLHEATKPTEKKAE
jgi:hypothetical protein